MLLIAVVFIVYTVYTNFIGDPKAAAFLDHKTDLKRALHVSSWLTVMKVHVVFACLLMISGAINFSTAILKKRQRKFHRWNGYLYAVSVLIVVVTSGYMAPYATGGKAASMAFNLLNIIWPIFTVIAIVKIRKKQLPQHREWMTRSYAFVFTNLLIHALHTLLINGFGLEYANSYVISIYATIILLLLAAEIVIRTVLRRSIRTA
ncbi:putative membrane protein DUF2306 [Paenibacillus cellulosilyticus]|uniref:Putative membrane protein DUF2306 n=1 Tax=Paenibacillus cellulosilyticus TaxID=375489 RepID=A0A2V2Z349_9BACL|nr:DUF2306 domain-containing protein [Paenibacillus cellulosilyticus]PWW08686.1 putative membrane protein DUF2306 [Paenibacillus cellulosilyticus]